MKISTAGRVCRNREDEGSGLIYDDVMGGGRMLLGVLKKAERKNMNSLHPASVQKLGSLCFDRLANLWSATKSGRMKTQAGLFFSSKARWWREKKIIKNVHAHPVSTSKALRAIWRYRYAMNLSDCWVWSVLTPLSAHISTESACVSTSCYNKYYGCFSEWGQVMSVVCKIFSSLSSHFRNCNHQNIMFFILKIEWNNQLSKMCTRSSSTDTESTNLLVLIPAV